MSVLQKFLVDLKRNKRRTGLLIGLVVVGAVVMIRQFSGSTPEEADARNVQPAGQSDPATPGTPGQAGTGSANQAGPSQTGKSAGAVAPGPRKVFRFAGDDNSMSVPRRNPFQVNIESFRPDPDAAPAPAKRKVQEVFVDPLVQRRAQELALIAAAEKLPLRSILMANPPQAMLDTTIVKAGQTIGPFTVSKITPTAVTLCKDGFEVVLKLEKK